MSDIYDEWPSSPGWGDEGHSVSNQLDLLMASEILSTL